MFPLYDGVSVVGFKCVVAGRVITGVVEEKRQARKDYTEAVARGETAALLERVTDAADCFTTHVGNVPAGEKVIVEVTYLGELKQDAETDGVRFAIPTMIAPRYGQSSADLGELTKDATSATDEQGIRILVDIAVENGITIRGVQSPSHPIAMTMGRTSSMPEDAFDNQHASATLTLGSTELDKDFIIVVTPKGHDTPCALLESHPTIPNHRALMATLVPKFNLPSIRPEIVFVADRSGSMEGKIPILVSALKVFLKSLPVGIKFNICSFGSRHEFLWSRSKTYDESSLSTALLHVDSFRANFGGTEILPPIQDTVQNRYRDMHLEVVVVTDGQIWNQEKLLSFISDATTKSVRFFSLGVGHGASSSLVEGIARVGDGFAQFVGENEKMEKRVVRMLKAAVTPHIKDYTMEVKYEKADEEFEMVESVTESLKILGTDSGNAGSKPKKAISLFDKSAKADEKIDEMAGKYDHLPPISAPKLMQTPHKIQPLYPSNRSTVYLLMSADSCQHTPKSVVLRATSDHGPLELEILVQDIGTGETIHQLAARKAIQELEDGHGWIGEAKDTHGRLLKSQLEGRWDEIVEREAVRLGVEYQVGGKWCSFVAVEKNADNSEENWPDYEMIDNDGSRLHAQSTGKVSFPSCLNTQSAPNASYFAESATSKSLFGIPGGTFGNSSISSSATGYGSSGSDTGSHRTNTSGILWNDPLSRGFEAPAEDILSPPKSVCGGVNFGTFYGSDCQKFARSSFNAGQFSFGASSSGGVIESNGPAQNPDWTDFGSQDSGLFGNTNGSTPMTSARGLPCKCARAEDQCAIPRATFRKAFSVSSGIDQPQSLLPSNGSFQAKRFGSHHATGLGAAASTSSTSLFPSSTSLAQSSPITNAQKKTLANEILAIDSSRTYSASMLEGVELVGKPTGGLFGGGILSPLSTTGMNVSMGGSVAQRAKRPKPACSSPFATAGAALHSTQAPVQQMAHRRYVYQSLDHYSDKDQKMADAPGAKAILLPKKDEEGMYEVISLQTFDGSWKWTEGLFTVLGVGEQKAKDILSGLGEAVMATLLAVAFFEEKMAHQEGVWEMVVEKAKGWLEERIGRERCADGLTKVKTEIFKNA